MNCPRTGHIWDRPLSPCLFSCQHPDGRRFCEFCLATEGEPNEQNELDDEFDRPFTPMFLGGQGEQDVESEGSSVLFALIVSLLVGLLLWVAIFLLLSK